MKDYQSIELRENDGVATIVLNRPQQSNAIDERMQVELLDAIEYACANYSIRVIVLTGAGKNFSAGADLLDRLKKPEYTASMLLEEYFKPILLSIYNAKKPFISAINGSAAGVASALALVCDLTVMADDACIYQAFSNISLIPDGGACWHLVHQLGYRRAYEMVIEGERMPAATCKELGLANRVVPAQELVTAAEQWAKELTHKAPLALRYSKEALRKAELTDLEDTMDIEGRIQDVIMKSKDAQEGISAFFEKRKPEYVGS